MVRWRPMLASDLPAAEAMGSAFHIHHPEGPEIAPERLRLAANFCFVLDSEDGGVAGYCVAHPWGGRLPPGLNELIHDLPAAADTLHIHDVVLAERTRGQGHATALLAILADRAARCGLGWMSLVAVGDAGRYWARQGFVPDADPARIDYVRASYGADGTPMRRSTDSIAAA